MTMAIIDPDTASIATVFDVSYLKARLLKALSFGIPASVADLWFCAGREMELTQDYMRGEMAKHLRYFRDHPAGLKIEQTYLDGPYIIRDADTLQAIRAAMDTPP